MEFTRLGGPEGQLCNLQAGRWVVAFQKEGPDNNHVMDIIVEAEHTNTANVTFRVEESPDGVTWTHTEQHPGVTLVPGGRTQFRVAHSHSWVQLLAYCGAVGQIAVDSRVPGSRSQPRQVPGVLACATDAEVVYL